MFSRSFLRGRFGLFGLAATSLIFLVIVTDVHAKRGCFAYGHSCLGGLGKRADAREPDMGPTPIDGRTDSGNGMEEVMRATRFGGHDEAWPWMDGRMDNGGEQLAPAERQLRDQKLTPQQLYELSPFIRQLMRNMHNNQDLNMPDI